jgi:hypothetical protein
VEGWLSEEQAITPLSNSVLRSFQLAGLVGRYFRDVLLQRDNRKLVPGIHLCCKTQFDLGMNAMFAARRSRIKDTPRGVIPFEAMRALGVSRLSQQFAAGTPFSQIRRSLGR